MAVAYTDNIGLGRSLPLDSRYCTVEDTTGGYKLYDSDRDAREKVVRESRYKGLTVGIKKSITDPTTGRSIEVVEEWWWRKGIENGDLEIKTLGSSFDGVANGISLGNADPNNNKIILGGTLNQATKIETSSTNTLAITNLQTPTATSGYSLVAVDNSTDTAKVGILRKFDFVTISTAVVGPTNGIKRFTVSDSDTTNSINIGLGGDLTKPTTEIIGTDIANQSLSFEIKETTGNKLYNKFALNKDSLTIESGSNSSTNSISSLAIYKSNTNLWTTNYNSTAYNANASWNDSHSWAQTTDAQSFKIFDNVVKTTRTEAVLGHYYDERVGSDAWQDTWTGGHTLVSGKVYTLRTKKSGDSFPATLGTTYPGTSASPNTSGWVFTSNGTQPTTWTNGSVVDGYYPKIDFDTRSAMVKLYETNAGRGQVLIRARTTSVESNSVILGSPDSNYPDDPFGNTYRSEYALMFGYSNVIQSPSGQTPTNNIILGRGNRIGSISSLNTPVSSFIIGEGNIAQYGFTGAMGTSINNYARYSYGIGYALTIPESLSYTFFNTSTSNNATNTNLVSGVFQIGMFNNPIGADFNRLQYYPVGYKTSGTTTDPTVRTGYLQTPVFSIGSGVQGTETAAFNNNVFNVMSNGTVKVYDGIDAKYGTYGVTLPQWATNGWTATTGRTFTKGFKYKIGTYGFCIVANASSTGTTITGTMSGTPTGTGLPLRVGAAVEFVSGTGSILAQTKIASIIPAGTTPSTGSVTFTVDVAPAIALSGATIRIGDNFNNIIGNPVDTSNPTITDQGVGIIWGSRNTTGCVFIAQATTGTSPILWQYGSSIVQVGRPPATDTTVGTIGYNLETNAVEVFCGDTNAGGTGWRQITTTAV